MNATRPLCASAVTPINAINKTIIGNKIKKSSDFEQDIILGISSLTDDNSV